MQTGRRDVQAASSGNGDLQAHLKAELDGIAQAAGVQSATLVRRDGIHVLHAARKPLNQEILSAMSAMLIGAAETVFSEIGEKTISSVVIESERVKMIALGLNPEFVLVVLAESQTSLESLMPRVRDAARRLVESMR